MPELPDVALYVEHLQKRFVGERLARVRVASPFVLRTAVPPIREAEGKRLEAVQRLGKRIVLEFEDDAFLVVHLMVAGRFRLIEAGARIPGKLGLLALDFARESLLLTEAGTKKRASMHFVRGRAELSSFDRGGLEVFEASFEQFVHRLTLQRHTLKRALTDPTLLSGIGNAFSDEILHQAGLSPLKLTSALSTEEWRRLFAATQETLRLWLNRLREQTGAEFPTKVTAFREGMAAHGRFGEPCPVCGAAIARIVYADNETNYCPVCQTGGKLLADRSMSRLLGRDWPRSLEELEELRPAALGKPHPKRVTRRAMPGAAPAKAREPESTSRRTKANARRPS